MSSPQPKTLRRGLTLVELMVALTLLVVALGGTLTSQLASQRLLDEAHETQIATLALSSAMDEILAQPKPTLLAGTGLYVPNQELDVEELLADQVMTFRTPGYTVGGVEPEILEVRVELSWRSRTGADRQLALSCAKQ